MTRAVDWMRPFLSTKFIGSGAMDRPLDPCLRKLEPFGRSVGLHFRPWRKFHHAASIEAAKVPRGYLRMEHRAPAWSAQHRLQYVSLGARCMRGLPPNRQHLCAQDTGSSTCSAKLTSRLAAARKTAAPFSRNSYDAV